MTPGVPRDDDQRRPASVSPPEWFKTQATARTPELRDEFDDTWPESWQAAADLLTWEQPYNTVLDDSDAPFYRWFAGGQLNASYNCVDRHAGSGRTALEWTGNLGETRSYTYAELQDEVEALAAGLRDLGVEEGDIVTIYLPMIPELPIAMLACARLGAPHSVVFAGFSANALATRMDAASSEYLITSDGFYRRGDAIAQKRRVGDALLQLDHDVSEVVVVDRLEEEASRDLFSGERPYRELVDAHAGSTVPPVSRSADDMLFLMYTSGTTGKPKGVTHAVGGYLAQAAWTTRTVLDVTPQDTIWTKADIGWITGHTYAVYGPLSVGATTLIYEGASDTPNRERVERLIESNSVDVFYTSATAIRSMMKRRPPETDHDLSSLRLLGSVGEPIGTDAWWWYHDEFGGGECPVVDTWWQTETGGILITTLPGIDRMKPGAAGQPIPGVDARIVDPDGDPVDAGQAGYLTVHRPWPGMARTIFGDDQRFIEEYWQQYSDPDDDRWVYYTGDGAQRDTDGYIRLLGRVDDVINVAGGRLRTVEVESAILDLPEVAEAAVVGGREDTGRTVVFAYVTPADDVEHSRESLRETVRQRITESVGTVADPGRIVITPDLPKTRSGKIMRRLLEDLSNDDEYGDTSALRNPEIVGEIESSLQESD